MNFIDMPSQYWTQDLDITVQRTPTKPDRIEAIINSVDNDVYWSDGQNLLYCLQNYPILLGVWPSENRNPLNIDLRLDSLLVTYNILTNLISMGQEVLASDDPDKKVNRVLINKDSVVFKTIAIKDGIELYIESLCNENTEMGRVHQEDDLGTKFRIETTYPIPTKIVRAMERNITVANEEGTFDNWSMEISRYELIGKNTEEWDINFLMSCLLPKHQISYVIIRDNIHGERYAKVFKPGGWGSYTIAMEIEGKLYTTGLSERGIAFVEEKFRNIREGRFLIPNFFLK